MPDALIYTLIGAGGAALVAVAVATFAGSDGPTLTSEQLFKLEQQRTEMRQALLMDQEFMGCVVIIGGILLAFLLVAGFMLGGCLVDNPRIPGYPQYCSLRRFGR